MSLVAALRGRGRAVVDADAHAVAGRACASRSRAIRCPRTGATSWCRSRARGRPTKICSRTRATASASICAAGLPRCGGPASARSRRAASCSSPSPSRRGPAVPRRRAWSHRQRVRPAVGARSRGCASRRPAVSPARRSTPMCRRSRTSTAGAGSPRRESEAAVEPSQPATRDAEVPVAIRIAITENVRTVVGSVRVDGQRGASRSAELLTGLGLQPGRPFFLTQMAVDRDAIQLRYANRGFQNATVDSNPGLERRRHAAPTSCSRVREGPRVFVDHVLIVGNDGRARKPSSASCSSSPAIRWVSPRSPRASAAWPRSGCSAARGSPSSATATKRRATCWSRSRRRRSRRSATAAVSRPGAVRARRRAEAASPRAARVRAARVLRDRPAQPVRQEPLGEPVHAHQPPAAGLRRESTKSPTSGYGFSEYRVLGTFREPRVFGTAADAFLTGIVEQQIRSSFNFARRAFNAEAGAPPDARGQRQRQLPDSAHRALRRADRPEGQAADRPAVSAGPAVVVLPVGDPRHARRSARSGRAATI